ECPAVPAEESKLLKSLKSWESVGIRYINLHELMYEPGTPSSLLDWDKVGLVTPMNLTYRPDNLGKYCPI
ncbi:MAG TPA: hypothetical protein VHO90_00940, partial [Bacteroidales bacterium]|nr:hypothetical protein [Bacteroidales bacterium]